MKQVNNSKNKTNPQYKSWKQSLILDNRQITSFNKDLNKLFSFSQTIHPWNDVISKTLKQYDQKQQAIDAQDKKVSNKLKDMFGSIAGLKVTLSKQQNTNQFLLKVQKQSEGIYSKIEKFKESMSNEFEQMIDSEQAIQADLKLYDDKIQAIVEGRYEGGAGGADGLRQQRRMQENIGNLGNKQNNHQYQKQQKRLYSVGIDGKKKHSSQEGNQPPPETKQQNSSKQATLQLRIQQLNQQLKTTQQQVQTIQNKITNLGKNLGWVQQDHNDFIKIWNRLNPTAVPTAVPTTPHAHKPIKNYFQIQQQLIQYFKLYTGQQIRDHMNKYIKCKKLLQEKKEKILEYKTFKEQKKVIQFEIIAQREQRQKAKQRSINQVKRTQEQQIQMKQKVQEWKQKKKQKKQREEKLRMIEEQRKQQERIQRMVQNQQKKQALEQWRQEQEQMRRQRQRQHIQGSRTSKRTSSTNNAQIDKQTQERICARQEKLIAEKMENLIRKKMEEEQKAKVFFFVYIDQKQQKLKQQKQIKYSYINSKLQDKTTAIKEKERQKFDGKQKKEANTFGGNLLGVGVRATPAWMQGI